MKIHGTTTTRLLVGFAILGVTLSGCAAATPSATNTDPASAGAPDCVPGPPQDLPEDPDGVLESLPEIAIDALKGYGGTIFASPWEDFAPSHAAPWTVGFSGNQANAQNILMQDGVQEIIDANPTLFDAEIISVTATPANDAASQIQGMQTLLQKGVDIIIAPLASPTALNGVIDQAAEQGVPVISILGQSTSLNAVNVQPNPGQNGYYAAAGLLDQIGDTGTVLTVRSIPGLSIDTSIYDAAKRVFDACPGIETVGELTGYFNPAAAKTETLKFLTTHPGTIDGAFNVANMASGIISAFEQTGRPVPTVADIGGNGAAMAYWRDHPDYNGVAVSLPTQGTARFAMAIGLAMLEGRGLKTTEVAFSPTLITSENFSEWIEADWDETTNVQAEGPSSSIPIDDLVDAFFLN